MREREMEFCPFRTVMETFPAVLVGQGDVTRTRFELCLKEKCPAFRVMRGFESCLRLEKQDRSMSKRVEEILRGMPREDLRVREDYRDDGLRVKLATHYLIGYLGNETPENNRAVYSGKEIAELLESVCNGIE